MFSPAPNQIWKELSSDRFIRLIDVQSSYIQLRECDSHGDFLKGSRIQRILPGGFDGTEYTFVKQTP